KCGNGLGVLDSVKSTWGAEKPTYNYTKVYSYDAVTGNNVNGKEVPEGGSVKGAAANSTLTTGAATPGVTSTGGAVANVAAMVPVLAGLVAAMMLQLTSGPAISQEIAGGGGQISERTQSDTVAPSIRKEVEADMKKRRVAEAAALSGPTEPQRLRRKELIDEKARFKEIFVAQNARVAKAKAASDQATKRYMAERSLKREEEERYSAILSGLDTIPDEVENWGEDGGNEVKKMEEILT
ncbi:hypothetical protein V491_08070, partial [Pseudogymnoascus sp. VKM F-3775]